MQIEQRSSQATENREGESSI